MLLELSKNHVYNVISFYWKKSNFQIFLINLLNFSQNTNNVPDMTNIWQKTIWNIFLQPHSIFLPKPFFTQNQKLKRKKHGPMFYQKCTWFE